MTTAVAQRSVIPLFPYQQEAFDAVWKAYEAGTNHLLVSLPTGAGKTYLASHLVSEARRRGFGRALFVVHRDELVTQSVRALTQINPNLTVGVVKAGQDQLHADMIVASAQTLARPQRLERLGRALSGVPVLYLDDECHHSIAPSRRRAIETIDPALLVGLTATPNRGDRVGLDAIYDEIVYHLPMLELIAMNKLAHLVGLRIETATDLDGVHTRAGEFAEDELADTVDTEARNRLIVESYIRHARDRRKTVAFCVNVRHGEHLRDAFRAAGIRAEVVFGHTPSEERVRLLAAFHQGEIPVLVNVMVLSEGYDEPGIDCILWCRPTKSQSLFVQCIGRGARRSDEKPNCLVLDFVDASSRHKLVTFPSLAGIEPSLSPGRTSDPVMAEGEQVDLLEMARTHKRLHELAAIEVNLFSNSPYLWRTVGGERMTPAGNGAWLWLRQEQDGFVPVLMTQGRDEGGWQTKQKPLFDRPLDLETAMDVAENRIDLSPLTSREAGWRQRSEPPSDGQVRFARSLHIGVPAGITKAELSELIDERLFTNALHRAKREMK